VSISSNSWFYDRDAKTRVRSHHERWVTLLGVTCLARACESTGAWSRGLADKRPHSSSSSSSSWNSLADSRRIREWVCGQSAASQSQRAPTGRCDVSTYVIIQHRRTDDSISPR